MGRSKTLVIGITGSMAMGKSTLVSLIRRTSKIPIWDADQSVRDMLSTNKNIIKRVANLFPETLQRGVIDRGILKKNVFSCAENLIKLEKILHPALKEERQCFIKSCRKMGATYCFLDIPILFETGADEECDYVIVVSAPAFLQAQRIRSRFGTTVNVQAVLARQLSDFEKRKRADCIIHAGIGRHEALKQLITYLGKL